MHIPLDTPEVSIIVTHNMKKYLECSDLNLSWFYSVNTLFMNNNSWRIRIERTCREERENLGLLKKLQQLRAPVVFDVVKSDVPEVNKLVLRC